MRSSCQKTINSDNKKVVVLTFYFEKIKIRVVGSRGDFLAQGQNIFGDLCEQFVDARLDLFS